MHEVVYSFVANRSWFFLLCAPAAAICLATNILTNLLAWLRLRSNAKLKTPPILPYWIPFWGNTLPFLQDSGGFVENIGKSHGKSVPVEVTLGPIRGYVVSKPSQFATLLQASRILTPKPLIALAMENMFGTPKDAMHIYRNDNSGIGPNPIAGTNVKPEHRVFYHQHLSAHRFLTGQNLNKLTERFVAVLSKEAYHDTRITESWTELTDFFDFWKSVVLRAAVTALFGPWILKLNPDFEKDFWAYVDATPTLMKSAPRFMAPRAYAARDRVFTAIKKWHRFAREKSNYRMNSPADPDWDEYWGSSWLKVRQQFGQDTGEFSEDAMAAEDTALLIAANANAILSSIWFLLEIVTDKSLKRRVSPEFDACLVKDSNKSGSSPLDFDVTSIVTSPLLQSIYAEVLRMRIALIINRTPDKADFTMDGWRFQKQRFITMSTQVAAHSEEAWRAAGSHLVDKPLDQFWADRFLLPDKSNPDEKRFSMDGLAGAWIPYGGGAFMCPGRHFAKQEIMASVAVFAAYYDVEIIGKPDGWMPKSDRRMYGLGAMPPGEAIPVRIRKKVGTPVAVRPQKRRTSSMKVRGNWFCDKD